MTTWIGAALLATTLSFGVAAGASPAAAASAEVQKPQSAQATDISARRQDRPRRYAYRPYYPYYYGRPSTYAPAPILPIPPFFGYGWEWW
jgi:hypothetical protein